MRQLRLLAFFLFGVVLAAVPMFAFADSYAPKETYTAPPSFTSDSASAAAVKYCQLYGQSMMDFHFDWSGSTKYLITNCTGQKNLNTQVLFSCPYGGSLGYVGSTPTCLNAPACTAPQVRNPSTGQCEAPACPTGDTYGWYSSPIGGDLSGDYCAGGCSYKLALDLDPAKEAFFSSTTKWLPMVRMGLGTACTGGTAPPEGSTTSPKEPEKPSPCATGEGVISTAAGKIYCVPGAKPGADKPVVTERKSEEVKPDGSTVTTTVTQTCTGAGACSSTNVTVVTGVGGASGPGATPGQAGTPGTTVGNTQKPAEATSEFCAKNPSLQMCKGGMNEEATQKSVLEEIKKLGNPTVSDDSSIKNATHSADSQKALEDENKKFTDAATGTVDPASGSKSSWRSAMESGWFTPIAITGCQPLHFTIGGRPWDWDPCPVADQISDIGAYGLWFMLLVGVFVMLTGGRRET